ncbi:MAG: hypothetical protein KME27_09430 [Lyngbya sp. HA4199-MV5]|jgi:hypothetical protein|nr:hypothetical protein [Lyngbya sp. HA4199-MV5]
MSIEEECINLLNEQLRTLRFNASVKRFATLIDEESGRDRFYEFIQILRQGDESAKRFLIDVIKLDLRRYDELQGNYLTIIFSAFVTRFGNDIYIYLIYVERPSLLYEIIIRKQAKNYRSGIKFIDRRDICDFRKLINLGFNKTYLQEIEDHLKDLLDLEIEESKSLRNNEELKRENIPQNKLDLLKMSDDDRLKVYQIISEDQDFKDDARTLVCVEANLERDVEGIDFNAKNRRTLVWQLIDKLLKSKRLGKLLVAISRHEDLSDLQATDLKQILQKYSFPDD